MAEGNKNSIKYQEEKINYSESSDIVSDYQIPLNFAVENDVDDDTLSVLSLFSGCGGMDLGFEGHFIAKYI